MAYKYANTTYNPNNSKYNYDSLGIFKNMTESGKKDFEKEMQRQYWQAQAVNDANGMWDANQRMNDYRTYFGMTNQIQNPNQALAQAEDAGQLDRNDPTYDQKRYDALQEHNLLQEGDVDPSTIISTTDGAAATKEQQQAPGAGSFSAHKKATNANADEDSGVGNFSYNPDSDPLWQAYLGRYTEQSDRAARNAIAEVSANTGGLGSSYATTAANQAANYYTQAANDAFMDIYQQKYQQYLDKLDQQNYANEQAYDQYYQNQQLAQGWAGVNQSQQQINNDLANTKWQQNYTQSSADSNYLLSLSQIAAQNGDYGLVYDLIKKMGY